MASPARIAANRRNAKKSTGPKTAVGKAAASHNAMKHGLHAKDVVCAEEDSREYQEVAEAVFADLAPVGTVEELLADRIATYTWRLQRMVCTEAAMFDDPLGYGGLKPGESAYAKRFDRSTSEMIALSRYEASLDRSLGRAYALLERRQARRRGEPVPAPVTVLVEGLPEPLEAGSAKPLSDKANYEKCETKPMVDVTPANATTR
ncbi:MAG TPA: hypothetical protein VGF92_13995 [Stellaceae bacterium]|jgi:hypothetical protein